MRMLKCYFLYRHLLRKYGIGQIKKTGISKKFILCKYVPYKKTLKIH